MEKISLPHFVLSISGGILSIGAILILFAWKFYSLTLLIPGIALVVLGAALLKGIIKRIPFPEAWIIDRRGELITMSPGYHAIITWFGYDKIYRKIKTVQYSIELFSDIKGPISIDLKKGGEIILHDPRIWIKVKDPLKAASVATNFEEQIREIVENRITGAINQMTFEEIMQIRVPKLLLPEGKEEGIKEGFKKKIDEIVKESKGLQDFLSEAGVEFLGFTLDDFDFDTETTEQRRKRIITQMEKEIAKNKAQATSNELSAIAKAANILENAGFQRDKAQEIASQRYQDHLAAQKGTLQKIIWQGSGISIPEIAAQWDMGKRILQPQPKKKLKIKKKRRKYKNPQEMSNEELRELVGF